MITVKIRSNEPFERAFKRFTKTCEKSGLLSEIRKNQHYEKPSEERKRKNKQAVRQQIRLMRYLNQ
jgi:small subunit ribosomal protein S21